MLFLIFLLGTSGVSLAQTNAASWQNLRTLGAGERIQVVEVRSGKHAGVFVSASDTAIVLRESSGERTVQKEDVRSVKLVKKGHRLRNTLIGAGVGAGAGAGITAGAWESSGFLGGKGAGAAVGAVIGGLGGAIVGAVLPSHETIYSAKGR
jgi:hypothetical protein